MLHRNGPCQSMHNEEIQPTVYSGEQDVLNCVRKTECAKGKLQHLFEDFKLIARQK